MKVERIVAGPFFVNTYIVSADGSREAVVVDPGDDAEKILSALEGGGYSVTHIFNTHGHGDHITANAALKKAFPSAKIYIHGRDAEMLSDTLANLSAAFGYQATSPPADGFFVGGRDMTAAGIEWRVEHVPGHSGGSVCLIPETEPPVVFSGDTRPGLQTALAKTGSTPRPTRVSSCGHRSTPSFFMSAGGLSHTMNLGSKYPV